MNALALDSISRDFTTPDGSAYRALHEITLAVEAGSFVAIVGPSGCGKSTLLNIAAGLLAPSTGTVHVNGARLTGLNRLATYMFQQDALLPWKTVTENVALGLTLGGVAVADAKARADAWLTRVDLAPFAAHYPAQLSGGMRKRVVMAQNWIIDRPILLMDEPFSALDVHTRQRMESELLELWEGSGSSRTLPEHGSRPPTPASVPAASGFRDAASVPAASGFRDTASVPAASGFRDTASASAASGFRDTASVSVVSGFSQTVRKTVIFVTHDLEEAIALADDVIVLSAGPEAHVVARHPVTLDRPRDLMELRTAPAFVDLYRAIWSVLRHEVIRSQARAHGRT